MARAADAPEHARTLLLAALATLLFAGALRGFISSVYYQNLATLALNATALYPLVLLAPALYALPALRRRPGAVLAVSAIALAVLRILMAPTRGGALHLPVAALASAAFLLLLPAALALARGPGGPAAFAAGAAAGYALDAALVWWGASVDPLAGVRGLLLLVPLGALLALVALGLARRAADHAPAATAPARAAKPALPAWLAGLGVGAWLFLEAAVLANPYGLARWNEADPRVMAAATALGLVAGALALTGLPRALPAWALVALNAVGLLAIVDHSALHRGLVPWTTPVAQLVLALDLAILLRALADAQGARPAAALAGGALGMVLAHFLLVFTFVFAYVPLGHLWKGKETVLLPLAALLVIAPAALAARRPGALAPARGADATRAAVALALAVLLAGGAAAAQRPAEVRAPEDDGTLRLMSFNVHQGFSNLGVVDPEVFVAVLEAHDPDVVVLQESDTPRYSSANVDVAGYLAGRLGYHVYYGQPTREQGFGSAVLTRHPILEASYHALPSGSDNRLYSEVALDVHGARVWLYAVHFGLPRDDREAQSQALLARAATREGPVILAGDFNSCPTGLCPEEDEGGDDVYNRTVARYQDAWVAAGHARDDPAGFTYDALAPFERIDYVFVSAQVEVVAMERVRSDAAVAASDHLPIVVELRVRQ